MTIADIQDLKKLREIKTKHGFSPNRKTKVEKVILEKLNIPKESLNKRLRGLEKEDEFYLLLLMVADIEQLTPLDQKQLVNKKKYTVPDFLLSVNIPKFMIKSKVPMAQRMFVEVKKCKDDELDFCITKEAYQKLRYYSQLYTLPLYFAIKFNTKHIKQWFFVSGEVIEKLSKQERRKIINRNQDCYVISITELLQKDMSGLWLNNYMVHIQEGTKIQKVYDSSLKKGSLIDKKMGVLKSHSITIGNKELKKSLLGENILLEEDIFSSLLKKLAQGKRKSKKSSSETIITFEADNNYFMPYYHLILQVYMQLRTQFKSVLKDSDDSIEYYINNFSDFDRTLISYIKKGYYTLVDEKFIFPIRMMPNFDKNKK